MTMFTSLIWKLRHCMRSKSVGLTSETELVYIPKSCRHGFPSSSCMHQELKHSLCSLRFSLSRPAFQSLTPPNFNLPSSILCTSNPEVLARAPTPHGSSGTHLRRLWKEMAYDRCGNFLIIQQPTKELLAADAHCSPWAVSMAGRQYFTLLISRNETTLKLAKCTWRSDRWRGMCSVELQNSFKLTWLFFLTVCLWQENLIAMLLSII